jgi:hypothetical protein
VALAPVVVDAPVSTTGMPRTYGPLNPSVQ